MRMVIYIVLAISIMYLIWAWKRQQMSAPTLEAPKQIKSRNKFRGKKNPNEIWVQVYETASLDEGKLFQARIQEEEIECILYEEGKKDIHGNPLKGIGIAVPKSSVALAQNIISRMEV